VSRISAFFSFAKTGNSKNGWKLKNCWDERERRKERERERKFDENFATICREILRKNFFLSKFSL
jgi:hypothetical protein